MYNYYTDLIWAIDKILFYLLVLGGAAVILYSMIRDARWKIRERALLNIKRNIYELVLSGADKRACLPAVSRITPEQFIDVSTNRNREAIFFNASEQELLKICFVSPGKLAAIEKTALSSWSKWRRVEAILTLGYARSERSVSALKKTVNDRDPDISYFSILALGQIKNAHSAKALLGFVRKRQFYRHRIFSLLEAFPPEIAEEVIGLIDHPDPQRRGWAIRLLCRLGAVQYIKKIEQLTDDDSPQVRAAACACLGEFGRKSSGDSIVKRLKDDSWMVRAAGLKALFKVWGKEGLPRIMELINDGSL
ncbi:MAG: HEAT repeat domain-containing protein, partial [Candidatus Omnitrophota bacterium]